MNQPELKKQPVSSNFLIATRRITDRPNLLIEPFKLHKTHIRISIANKSSMTVYTGKAWQMRYFYSFRKHLARIFSSGGSISIPGTFIGSYQAVMILL